MFERFTQSAREVVLQARQEARHLGDGWIGTEHVAVALAQDEGVAGQVLRRCGVSAEALRTELAGQARGGDDLDADALRRIGIDLDDVRKAVERTFGAGALEERSDRRGGGRLAFTKGAKHSLERALRHTVSLGHRSLGSEHVLLGMLDDVGEPGVRLLTARGVDIGQLRAATLHAARRSA